MSDALQSSIQFVKGVGPKKFRLLGRLNLKTILELLHYYPRRHEDRSHILPIAKVTLGQYNTLRGEVLASGIFKTKKGIRVFQLGVGDGSGVIYATWFNQPYLKRFFNVGDEVILYGKVERYKKLQINNPEFEVLTNQDRSIHMGRIVPIYPSTQNLTQRLLRTIAKRGVDQYASHVPETLPLTIKARQGLIDLSSAIRHIHFPSSFATLQNARRRLVFDEFFYLQTALALKRANLKLRTRGIPHKVDGRLSQDFLKSLPFSLTQAQIKAIEHIKKDMAQDRPMCRLLQGDVGSGKTVVAAYAMTTAVQSGYQAALMAPTEVLAQQHSLTISRMLLPLGIKVVPLASSLSPGKRRLAYRRISSGQADVVVGTHSLIQEKVEFKRLSFIVVDEQHKFGVVQRSDLASKGENPDILVMTATPIPRTLALTVYGDLDISIINQLPPGRRSVKTYWVGEDKRGRMYDFFRKQAGMGRQIFVVYPVIEESRIMDLKAATKMYEEFRDKVFQDLRVELLHGRMSDRQKDEVMRRFKGRDVDILVSTVLIEVGIDVPNAAVMVVEHAERFGLAQLHQLRGRIGRSTHQSYCILVGYARTQEARQRLQAMVNTSDGFRISEEDLKIRGPGDFFGTRQSGIPEFKIADIARDIGSLESAKQEAFNLVNRDPLLQRPEHQGIKGHVAKHFSALGPFGL